MYTLRDYFLTSLPFIPTKPVFRRLLTRKDTIFRCVGQIKLNHTPQITGAVYDFQVPEREDLPFWAREGKGAI